MRKLTKMETLQSELPSISIFNAFLTQVVCWEIQENATSITEVTTTALIRNFAYLKCTDMDTTLDFDKLLGKRSKNK